MARIKGQGRIWQVLIDENLVQFDVLKWTGDKPVLVRFFWRAVPRHADRDYHHSVRPAKLDSFAAVANGNANLQNINEIFEDIEALRRLKELQKMSQRLQPATDEADVEGEKLTVPFLTPQPSQPAPVSPDEFLAHLAWSGDQLISVKVTGENMCWQPRLKRPYDRRERRIDWSASAEW